MKDSSKYGARLKALCTRLRREKSSGTEVAGSDVTTELVMACLSEYMTESKARAGLNKLRGALVDFNELRVCRVEEIAGILGKNTPNASEAAEKTVTVLGAVFAANDSMDLSHLQEGGKREARVFVEGLEGADAYIVARVMLRSMGAHAFPVHEQMMKMLQQEEVVLASADAADVRGFLERHISASEIAKDYAMLRYHADKVKVPKRASAGGAESKAKASKAKDKSAAPAKSTSAGATNKAGKAKKTSKKSGQQKS